MSGNVTSPSATFPAPILLGTLPDAREGSKCVTLNINWQNAGTRIPVNLLSQFQSGAFTAIQAIYVDNSTCANACEIYCQETGQVVIVPGFTVGMYPLLTNTAPQFVLTTLWVSAGGSPLYIQSTTSFYFLNTPQNYFQSSLPLLGMGTGSVAALATILTGGARSLVINGGGGAPNDGSGRTTGWYMVLNAMTLSLSPSNSGAFAGTTQMIVRLSESPNGSGGTVRWSDIIVVAQGTNTTFYRRDVIWPTGLRMFTPGNSWWIDVDVVPGLFGYLAAINLTFGFVNIS